MRVLLLLIALLTLVTAAIAQRPDAASDRTARRGRVVIVPLLNVSGEKWEDLKTKQVDKATEYLVGEFGRLGFEIVPEREVRNAIVDLEIDFRDEEQQKRSTLYELGRKLNADYILFGMITHTEQKEFQRVLYKDIEGRTDAKIWFLNVPDERAILSAKTFTGRSGGNRVTLKPSDRQIQAAANAFRDALQDFFGSVRRSGDKLVAPMATSRRNPVGG